MEKVIIRTGRTETGYCGSCDRLPGMIVAGYDDFEEYKKHVQETIDFHLDGLREDGDEYDPVFDGEYELDFCFDVEALLCYLRGFISFSALERLTGIHQKQLANYAAGRNIPREEQALKIEDGLHRLGQILINVKI